RAMPPEKWREDRQREAMGRIAGRLSAWGQDALDRITGLYDTVDAPEEFDGREAELWTPLLVVATDAGRYDEAALAAQTILGSVEPVETEGMALLRACYEAFGAETRLST